MSSDLEQFLEVVRKASTEVAEDPGCDADAWRSMESTGLPTLASDTSEEPDAIQWLAHTVRAAAESSPSLAFILAARYTAELTIRELDAQEDSPLAPEDSKLVPTFALASRNSRPVAATAPEADTVVVFDVDNSEASTVSWAEVKDGAEFEPRTGLTAARLASFTVPATAEAVPVATSNVAASWDLLTGAALVGIAERAVSATRTYVLERKQFGLPIGSFAGLRALVADMQLRVEPVRALLDLTTEDLMHSESVSCLAGRIAIANCIDAIQAHGGYGYINEYPVADLLRDAVSLQARAGGRRIHVARVAKRALGAPEVLRT